MSPASDRVARTWPVCAPLAKAHIMVRQGIDGGRLEGRALTADAIRETQRRYCELVTEDLLRIDDPVNKPRMEPGDIGKYVTDW